MPVTFTVGTEPPIDIDLDFDEVELTAGHTYLVVVSNVTLFQLRERLAHNQHLHVETSPLNIREAEALHRIRSVEPVLEG
jgi:hypothetical protein